MGGESHAASFLNHELATFRPLTVRGLSMGRERLVVMNECRNLVALGWASVLIPVHFWPKRPSEISFLPFNMILSFQYGTRLWSPDQNQV